MCENLDTLDEPEARASMIWIIGEYAERIDNADELLESFLEGFHDENTQVCSILIDYDLFWLMFIVQPKLQIRNYDCAALDVDNESTQCCKSDRAFRVGFGPKVAKNFGLNSGLRCAFCLRYTKI